MDSIRVDYIRKRREFGRPVDHLTVTEPRVLAVLPPLLASKTQDFLQKTSQNLEVSCIPKQSEHEVNTERVISKNMGVLHMEGGWPKDIDPTEKDQTQRYRKKVEKDFKAFTDKPLKDSATSQDFTDRINTYVRDINPYLPNPRTGDMLTEFVIEQLPPARTPDGIALMRQLRARQAPWATTRVLR